MGENRIHAPELPDTLQWLNTDGPLKLADQKGKVILLDFWTYCCINCMHILPDLTYLEQKYEDSLVVIGVHSPKFPQEKIGNNVQKAINRHHIRHPVAHDPGFTLWKQYGIRAWPSIIFIDPEGYVVGVLRGEGNRQQLDTMIEQHLNEADSKGVRRRSQMKVSIKHEPEKTLLFPGKILATPEVLFVSDSGHNRILELSHDGRVLHSYGSMAPGFLDGPGVGAAFNNPQGMALIGNNLYVADTDNHAIRQIDLTTQDVLTVAGTGQQGHATRIHFDDRLQAPLNSPWDLAYENGKLYIAMAGAHQIWVMDLTSRPIDIYAGSRREDIFDGEASTAAFAQPSGIVAGTYLEPSLFIADAETSAIRIIRLRNNQVKTLVGKGLFEFGDVDDRGDKVRLQHPLDVCFDQDKQALWISDTFNSKIKLLTLDFNDVSTLNVPHELNEPGGISLQGDTLWIANTNAHEILCFDVNTGECQALDVRETRTEGLL